MLLISLISVFDLFNPGLPITHDGQDHVARIANFYQNLSEGNIIPRWAGNLNWGYGHPILEFLYPLPSYIASFFHFLGFSFIDSVKIVFVLGMILSGIFMYLWLNSFLGKYAGFIGGILYMFVPYRFVEVYVRGDIGENLAFAFMPLVLYFIYKLSLKVKLKYIIGAAFSLALLILSHNAISLMYAPAIIGYCFYLLWINKFKKNLLFGFILLMLLGFGLSAFFWIPGLLEGKYTLRNIVTAGSYLGRFVAPKALLYGPWSYGGSGEFTLQLGIMQWVFLVLSPFFIIFLKTRKDKKYLLILGLVLYTLLAIFLMTSLSNFIWDKFILLQNFQFPWRFLAITVFTTAALGGFGIFIVSKKFKFAIVGSLVVLILLFNRNYWHALGFFYKPDSFFSGIYNSTTDTGESAPIWSVRFMEHRPNVNIEIVKGSGEIVELKHSITKRQYEIIVFDKLRVVESTLYFPGWVVEVDGKRTDIQFQDPIYRGLITFYLDKGKHLVNITYQETKIRFASNMISLSSLVLIVGVLAFNFIGKKHNKKNK